MLPPAESLDTSRPGKIADRNQGSRDSYHAVAIFLKVPMVKARDEGLKSMFNKESACFALLAWALFSTALADDIWFVSVCMYVHPNRVSAAVDFNVYIPFWTWAGRTEMQMSLFLGRWNRNDIS